MLCCLAQLMINQDAMTGIVHVEMVFDGRLHALKNDLCRIRRYGVIVFSCENHYRLGDAGQIAPNVYLEFV
jgi:hypothetical protein